MNLKAKTILALTGALGLTLGLSTQASAASISFNFTAPIALPTLSALVYTSTNTPGDTVTVQGFGVNVGTPQSTTAISDAFLDAYTGAGIAKGIGVCNQGDGPSGGDGGTASTTGTCGSANTQERFNDNVTTDDLILLTFSTPIAISDLDLTGNGTDGTAFTYWLGNGNVTNLTTLTLATLTTVANGFTAGVQVASLGSGAEDYIINTATTKQILIAASTLGGTERNLLAGINTVPEPTSVLLMGTGLLFGANRLRKVRKNRNA